MIEGEPWISDDNGEEVNKLPTASAGLLEESKPCGISVCEKQASADSEDSDLDSMKEELKKLEKEEKELIVQREKAELRRKLKEKRDAVKSLKEFRKVIIVGDSMIKNLPPIEGVEVRAIRGATIGKINFLLENRQLSLGSSNYIIIHAGTNNIANGNSCDYILSGLANLIATVRRLKTDIHIIVSSLLPRPVDKDETESVIKQVNTCFEKEMSKDLNVKFVKSFRPFLFKGRSKDFFLPI
ncbi:uncharacterized protein LOC132745913 isoform X1 [Ruditapes philippinarum]|uniref:uncharacterized protein LOC132745913 isoform X1 n=1 Tax=Ruditapes philippinarum TaxID=129788 RepID=UPI00295B3D61|nr:uncharacterized protein LOC132745913 isoform X1 [Ruditapes philippinarum]